ncbi:hypothetical protein F4818DRAFT_342092 [Hypoxylon cercidicola]|nr:hypothetical protein F4818DRAFT_342092 [Hypoxylon cercidicola]
MCTSILLDCGIIQHHSEDRKPHIRCVLGDNPVVARMNWPRTDTSFNDNDFRNFNYDRRPFKIVKKLHLEEAVCWDIRSSDDLTRWIEQRSISIFSRGGEHSSPSSLPISMNEFRQLIDLFHIHPTIVRTICREVASFYRMYLCDGTIVYTARTCSTWRHDDIALSSTYLSHERMNFSVFYGCNEKQSKCIVEGVEKAGSATCHPMLPPGLLVELDRKRLVKKIESVITNFVLTTETMSCASRDLETTRARNFMRRNSDAELPLTLYNEDRELANGIRIVMQQISSMTQHMYELESLRFSRRSETYILEYSNIEMQIRERLHEIGTEYEQKLDQLDGLCFTTQRASDLANIRIALATKKESTQMRSIALVTMIFLPVTSVAASSAPSP